jgi:HNH endonuclease
MKPRIERKGTRPSSRYLMIELSKDGKFKRFHVHRLILLAFRGPPKPGQECRHLDSDKHNNNISNLVWGTYEENREDWRKTRRGIVLTADQVRYIRASTATYRAIAAELGCSKSLVGLVKNDEIWQDPALYP